MSCPCYKSTLRMPANTHLRGLSQLPTHPQNQPPGAPWSGYAGVWRIDVSVGVLVECTVHTTGIDAAVAASNKPTKRRAVAGIVDWLLNTG